MSALNSDATVAGFHGEPAVNIAPVADTPHLSTEAASQPVASDHSDPLLGSRMGRFQIDAVLGSGGMGTVYRATQLEPIRRTVAIKTIRTGLAGDVALKRFHAERQALALLEHADIASIFEADATPRGEPYLVMEYCEGLPLDEFCEANNLSVSDRVALVARVARAVQHAHARGVVHRDLKPSNILVAETDEDVILNIIDFGIARFLDDDFVDVNSGATQAGELLGTPAYMSPEQVQSTPIDGRADVFALGAILFKLLTGSTPLRAPEGTTMSLVDIVSVVQSFEATTPSDRLRAEDVQNETRLVESMGFRNSNALIRRVTGDLDWIVLRATEADRTRRYATAGDFADDLQRHLDFQPIRAGRPSLLDRVSKFYQRRKPVVLGTAAVLMTAIFAAGAFGLDWWNRHQEHKAELARIEAECRPLLEDVLTIRNRVEQNSANARQVYVEEKQSLARAEALLKEQHGVDPQLRRKLAEAQSLIESDAQAMAFVDELNAARDRALLPRHASPEDDLGRAAALVGLSETFTSIGLVPGEADPQQAAGQLLRMPPFLMPDVIDALDFVILYEPIGAGVIVNESNGQFTTAMVLHNGPAGKTPLRANDRLLSINGLDLVEPDADGRMPGLAETCKELQSLPGSLIRIRAIRAGAEPFEITVQSQGHSAFWARDVLALIDPDPWRTSLRSAILAADVETLRELSNADLQGQHALSLIQLGFTRFRLERTQTPLRLIYQAQEQHPDDFWANFHAGLARSTVENPPKPIQGLSHFLACVALRPDCVGARAKLAGAYSQLGIYESAVAHFAVAGKLDPEGSWFAEDYCYAKAKLDAQRNGIGAESPGEQAEQQELRIYIKGSFDHIEMEARKLALSGDRTAALKVVRQLADEYPDDPRVLRARGAVLCDLQDYLPARLALFEAARKLPGDAATRFYHGVALQYSGETKSAIHEYKAALQLRPDYDAVHAFLDPLLAGTEPRTE